MVKGESCTWLQISSVVAVVVAEDHILSGAPTCPLDFDLASITLTLLFQNQPSCRH